MSLMFLTNTRSDIAFVVSMVSRYRRDPYILHFKGAKRIIWYVRSNIDYGIQYFHSKKIELFGFSDFNWGINLND